MNSVNRPATPRKILINQQLAGLNLLAGYLMGLCVTVRNLMPKNAAEHPTLRETSP
jgi:hypothetical protein